MLTWQLFKYYINQLYLKSQADWKVQKKGNIKGK